MSEEKGKKRSKSWYVQHAKRSKNARELDVGMQGVLITCNMKERKCSFEAYSLLNEYGDQLYGPEKFIQDENQSESDDEEDDAEAALKKEVSEIRSSTENNLRRFQALDSGANNVIFIRTLGVEPEKLVHHILKDLHTTKKKKSRVILRMLPVAGTCKAFIDDMKKFAKCFLEPWFKAPNKGTFQIVYKARNNNHMKREDVIKSLAEVIGSLNHENKVDLNNPEYTVIVEIIKNVCCMSVVRDYVLFRKYNLQEVVKNASESKPVQLLHAHSEDLTNSSEKEKHEGQNNQEQEKIELLDNPGQEVCGDSGSQEHGTATTEKNSTDLKQSS
ncbi:THUMP domain-containing protein 1 [Protopterus annectens]|uniref:THUMP domain-containing protein 1 n=1 Tax=Protopterus annectens TaxID=7888 RepID=UPI001CFC0340|nr:THUMP domain-containing protein 1 [Protopterus annectens]XP_043945435.1 THUMP domain-containing protein 1 [Protopterus annectens]